MHSADTADELAVAVAQLADVVAAQQGKRLGDAELVPQAFEPQRCALRAAFPKQPDHLAVRADGAPARVHFRDQAADPEPEQVRLRPAVREDLPEHLASFDGDVLFAALGGCYIDAARRQLPVQRVEVFSRGDDDAGTVRTQSTADESCQGLDERLRVLVELDQVLTVADFRPVIDGWRVFLHEKQNAVRAAGVPPSYTHDDQGRHPANGQSAAAAAGTVRVL
jgi:hypothetical protein